MAIELLFDVQERDGRQVLSVRGEIDAYTSPRLRERLRELLDRGDHRIVVDLEGVPFMDSTGLGVLVASLKRAKEHEGSISIAAPRPQIMRVLTITGLDKVFDVHDSLDEAVRGDAVAGSAGPT